MSKYVRELRNVPLPAPPQHDTDYPRWMQAMVRMLDYVFRRIVMAFDSLEHELDAEHLVYDNRVEHIGERWYFDKQTIFNEQVKFDKARPASQTYTIDADGIAAFHDEIRLLNDHTGLVFRDLYGWSDPKEYSITLSGGSASLKVDPDPQYQHDWGIQPEFDVGTAQHPMLLHVSGDFIHAGSKLGFFNKAPLAARTQVDNNPAATAGDTYTANERDMLQNVYDKLNELLDALRSYGLV